MNCPVCQTPLQIAERSGIEIDYCPKCRGVWLDRGELDKIIERADARYSNQSHGDYNNSHERHSSDRQEYHQEDRRQHGDDHHKKHKKEGLFDLFDF